MLIKAFPFRVLILLIAFPLVVYAGYRWYQHAHSIEQWPVVFDVPISLPMQRRFAVNEGVSVTFPEAEKAMQLALSTFRSGSNSVSSTEHLVSMLKNIWITWPESDAAVEASLFYLQTLAVDRSRALQQNARQDYVERAFQVPERYFSSEYQASSQSIAKHLLQAYIEDTQHDQAWQFCIRLRWFSPRTDIFAPLCQHLIEQSPDVALDSTKTYALLSPQIPMHSLEVEILSKALVENVQSYLVQPYDSEGMGKAIIELGRAGFKGLSEQLLLEMLQIDPVNTPKVEVALAKSR